MAKKLSRKEKEAISKFDFHVMLEIDTVADDAIVVIPDNESEYYVVKSRNKIDTTSNVIFTGKKFKQLMGY